MKTAEEWNQYLQERGWHTLPFAAIKTIQSDARRAALTEAAEICDSIASVHSSPSEIERYQYARDLILAARDKETGG